MTDRPWDLSWWEYAAQQGLPTSLSRPGVRVIERGPGSYVAKQKPARDFLSEPIDYLSLPLDALKARRF
jgi:hypothetical protein